MGLVKKARAAQRVGIFGGTFDPVHCGHLIAAEEIREKLGLDRIVFVTSANPPHKKGRRLAPARHRHEMVKLAIKVNRRFEFSDAEMKRRGYSYTIDTVAHFKHMLGESATIYFVVGSDAVEDLSKWKEIDKLLAMCAFVVLRRPGFFPRIGGKLRKKVAVVRIHGIDISSTEIKKKIAGGKSIKHLVPYQVERYIYDKKLYR